MLRIASWLIVSLLLVSNAQAQESDSYDEEFNRGITALTEGRLDEGIEAFEKCLTLKPEDPTCAYNITCGYSLKNELDAAFEWLGKAVDWGFVRDESNIKLAETDDGDLANLREDPRFAAIIERMKSELAERTEALEKEWKSPLLVLPDEHEKIEKLGALVVLHDAGSTKQAIADSFWMQLAHERNLALLVPSGMIAAGRKAEDGMAWFADFEAFTKRYWTAEDSLKPANELLKTLPNLDESRIFIAGEGQGALVATNVAIRAPRTYAGVLSVDAPLVLTMTQSYFPNAIDAGLKIRALCSTQSMWGVPDTNIQSFVARIRTALPMTKLDVELETYTPEEAKPKLRTELIASTLDAMEKQAPAEETEPVEAGADK